MNFGFFEYEQNLPFLWAFKLPAYNISDCHKTCHSHIICVFYCAIFFVDFYFLRFGEPEQNAFLCTIDFINYFCCSQEWWRGGGGKLT